MSISSQNQQFDDSESSSGRDPNQETASNGEDRGNEVMRDRDPTSDQERDKPSDQQRDQERDQERDQQRDQQRDQERDSNELPSRIGRYQILRQLGVGGFGFVYEAFDSELSRRLAIKVPRLDRVLTEKEIARFRDEGRTLAKINHPSIVTVHDVGRTDDGVPFVVMEFVEGTSLSRILKNKRKLEFDQVMQILVKIAEALRESHKASVVHRDLKPGNIIVDEDDFNQLKLVDFGLALHDDLSLSELGGSIEGTPSYMAPEQIRGENHRIDGQTDIWAFGVTMYRMLTGKLPFKGKTTVELARAIRYKEAKPPRQRNEHIPKPIEQICLRCMAKTIMDRYQSMQDVLDDLNSTLQKLSQPVEDHSQRFQSTAQTLQKFDQQQDSGRIHGGDPGRSSNSQRKSNSGVSETGISNTQSNSLVSQSAPLTIRFKGLRPFDSGDQTFFLSLLPGFRDLYGVPDSIRFWQQRIDGQDELEALTVGILYGPSGCGKSSFVRAGLIPILATETNPVYLECAPEGTEKRLLKQISRKIESVDENDSIADVFRQFRRGEHLEEGDKLVIFLDQFEQWLHGSSSVEQEELTEALRHCDGKNLICILLIRDDFWMSTSRLMKYLEVPIREGNNALSLPLFDERHARRVLVAYGRAFGRLPQVPDNDLDTAQLKPSQKQFIESAVKSLSSGSSVVCVYLSVFAQIARNQEWTGAELKRLGGLQGVGVRFLDELFFGFESKGAGNRLGIVSTILRELLDDSSVIKGKSKSVGQLAEACGTDPHDLAFDSVISQLENDFSLISFVDEYSKDENEEHSVTDGSLSSPDQSNHARIEQSRNREVKLTHDFLVGPIREWLERKQNETRQGRATRRLYELGSAWEATKDARFLPNSIEYFGIIRSAERPLKSRFKDYLASATGKIAKQFSMVAAALLVIVLASAGVFQLLKSNSEQSVIRQLVSDFTNLPTAESLEVEESWDLNNPMLIQELLVVAGSDEESSAARLRASSVLLERDPDEPVALVSFLDHWEQCELTDVSRVARTILCLSESRQSEVFEKIRSGSAEKLVEFGLAFLELGNCELLEFTLDSRNVDSRNPFIARLATRIKHPNDVLEKFSSDLADDSQAGLLLGLSRYESTLLQQSVRALPEDHDLIKLKTGAIDYSGLKVAVDQLFESVGESTNSSPTGEANWSEVPLVGGQSQIFIKLPAGTFSLDEDLPEEIRARYGENQASARMGDHTISEPVYLSSALINQELFQSFKESLPSYDARRRSLGLENSTGQELSRMPVGNLDWNLAAEFCNYLSELHGLTPCYEVSDFKCELNSSSSLITNSWLVNGFRLPPFVTHNIPGFKVADNEANGFRMPSFSEWVFAYKAESRSLYPYGSNEEYWSGFTRFRNSDNEQPLKLPLGSLLPNSLGFHDLSGQLHQWTETKLFPDSDLKIMILAGATADLSIHDGIPGMLSTNKAEARLNVYSFRLAISAEGLNRIQQKQDQPKD